MSGRGSRLLRHERRELERLRLREYKFACLATGWVWHKRAPYVGCFFVVDNVNWMMNGWSIDPPALRLSRPGQRALLPIADWAAMEYDVVADAWVPEGGPTPAPG